jgi:hypothetical protein
VIDFDARQAICPEGRPSVGWYPARTRGQETINVKFAGDDCRACDHTSQCTSSPVAGRYGRQLGLHPATPTSPKPKPAPDRPILRGEASTRCAPMWKAPSAKPSPSPAPAEPATEASPKPT